MMPNFNETVAFQRFRSRVEFQKQHSQMVVASLNKTFGFLRSRQRNGLTICEGLEIGSDIFDMLDHPIAEYARIINYSKRKNSEHTIIELYNAFSTYMKDLLKELYNFNPKAVIHKANESYKYSEIINFNKYEDIVNDMIKNIFRKLEDERSTPKLVNKITNHTGITIDESVERKAMSYLEMRHLIIHNQSKVDATYFNKYNDLIAVRLNCKIPTDYLIIKNAIDSVIAYIEMIDNKLLSASAVRSR